MGQLIRLADDKILESEAWVQRGHQRRIRICRACCCLGLRLEWRCYLAKTEGWFLGCDILLVQRLDPDIDRLDGFVRCGPELAEAIGVIIEDPVPQKPRWQGHADLLPFNSVKLDILEP